MLKVQNTVDTANTQNVPTSKISQAIWNAREVANLALDKVRSNKDTILKVAAATTALVALGAAIYYASQYDMSNFFKSSNEGSDQSSTQDSTENQKVDENTFKVDADSDTATIDLSSETSNQIVPTPAEIPTPAETPVPSVTPAPSGNGTYANQTLVTDPGLIPPGVIPGVH